MPNTSSAKKALRRSEKRYSRNLRFKSLYKEAEKNFRDALKKGTDATEAFRKLQSLIDTLIKKNILHLNTGSRRKASFAKMFRLAVTKA